VKRQSSYEDITRLQDRTYPEQQVENRYIRQAGVNLLATGIWWVSPKRLQTVNKNPIYQAIGYSTIVL
jgi:hypothetical protein